MHKLKEISKATMKKIIVAFIYFILIISTIYILFNKEFKLIKGLIDISSIEEYKEDLTDIKIDIDTNNLTKYPGYGTTYANLIIESININLPIYYGDSLEILSKGIGHSQRSYFPSEGGSILYMGHNTKDMLHELPNINIKDIITIETTYGTFNYEVYNVKIIKETELDEVPIQREEEILMIYTCYPIDTLTYTEYRYVVYAKKVDN